MLKTRSKHINIDERRVLTELKKNSKESIDAIAKKYSLSRQKVRKIINRVEKNGSIWGYHTVISDNKLDLKRYFILIKKTNLLVSEDKLNIITTRIVKNKIEKIGVYIDCSFFLHGSFDWLICLTAHNIKYVKKFIELFLVLFKGYVSNIEVLEVVFPVKKCGIDNQDLGEIKEILSLK